VTQRLRDTDPRHEAVINLWSDNCACSMGPNISPNPDASPAALARRPLGAG
jgi:hypothetical protein